MKTSETNSNDFLLLSFLKNINMEGEMLESLPDISSDDRILLFGKIEDGHMELYF